MRKCGVRGARIACPPADIEDLRGPERLPFVTCRTLTAFLLEIVEGDLDADSVLSFTYHLSHCSRCTRYLVQYRCTVEAARTACYALEDSMVLHDAFVESVLAAHQRRLRH